MDYAKVTLATIGTLIVAAAMGIVIAFWQFEASEWLLDALYASLVSEHGGEITDDYAEHLQSAFEEGVIQTPDGATRVRHVSAGILQLPTGQLVACDPLVFPETEPFSMPVPSGAYPVVLSIARLPSWGERVLFARIQFSDKKVTRWQMLTLPNQELSALKRDETFGYPVDAGTGGFGDASAFALYNQRQEEDEDYYEKLLDAFDKPDQKYVNFSLQREPPLNLIAFSSGLGDGMYSTFAGFDADGNLVAVVTDFFPWALATD